MKKKTKMKNPLKLKGVKFKEYLTTFGYDIALYVIMFLS